MLPRSSCLLSWKLPRSWRSRDWPRERRAPRMSRNVVSHFYLVMQTLLVIQTFTKVLKWRKHTHDECFFSMLRPQRCIFPYNNALSMPVMCQLLVYLCQVLVQLFTFQTLKIRVPAEAQDQYGDLYSWGRAEFDVLVDPPPLQAAFLKIFSWQGFKFNLDWNTICVCTGMCLGLVQFSSPLKSYASILDQLGSLCKGLVRVGGQLERDNPYALHRLQVRCYSHHQILFCQTRR